MRDWNLDGFSLNPKDFASTMVLHARVAELADARDLGSRGETLEGSSPSSRTPPSPAEARRRRAMADPPKPRRRRAREGTNLKYVYFLRSELRLRSNYVGVTRDFERRLAEHNANHSPYTSGGAPWIPVVVVRFEDDRKAERFEAYLKTGSGRAFAKRHFL
jgi:putative endonuclease